MTLTAVRVAEGLGPIGTDKWPEDSGAKRFLMRCVEVRGCSVTKNILINDLKVEGNNASSNLLMTNGGILYMLVRV